MLASHSMGSKLTDGLGVHDLHGDLWGRIDSVVLVGLEARVHTAFHGIAGLGECRLGNGVVLAHEGEDDHVAHGCLDLRGRVGKASGAADQDTVGGPWAGHDTRGTSGDGRRTDGSL